MSRETGVVMRMMLVLLPMYLSGVAYSSTPLTTRPAPAASQPERAAASDDRAELSAHQRVAGFIRLWAEVKYNYVFFDRVPEVDWDQVLDDYLPRVQRAQTTEQYYRLLQRCVAQLRDGHTSVYLPRDLRKDATYPVRLRRIGADVVIAEVAPAAAFAQPDLRPGLCVTHINGRDVASILAADIYPYLAASAPHDRDRRALRSLVQGNDGTEATLRLRDPDGTTKDMVLKCLHWRFGRTTFFQRLQAEFQGLGQGIVYIAIRSFSSDEAVRQFETRFDQIRRAKGLIIDVRDNGGGSSRHGYSIISHLIAEPVERPRWRTRKYLPAHRAWGEKEMWHEGEPRVIPPSTKTPYLGPVVVLTGPSTISAAEDFVVALHASKRATLVGERTAGTTGQPLIVELPGGGRARICTKHDLYPDGREYVGVGVIPDVEVQITQDAIAEGRDLVLEAGIKTVSRMAGVQSSLVLSSLTEGGGRRAEGAAEAQLVAVLAQAKVEYDALLAAYSRQDWKRVDQYGDNLADLLKNEVLLPLQEDLDRARQEDEKHGRMNEQRQYDLHRVACRKQAITEFFAPQSDVASVLHLVRTVESWSDEVHDLARDGHVAQIPKAFAKLEAAWRDFWQVVAVQLRPVRRATTLE
ncbi:MAG TPA: S41 family peptidase [Phycisphaerae bacterium]|nr:S41 family peptidase [Phycisphaerae bacterium]